VSYRARRIRPFGYGLDRNHRLPKSLSGLVLSHSLQSRGTAARRRGMVARTAAALAIDGSRVSEVLTTARSRLLVSALRFSFFTIAWNGVVGVAALVVATIDGSLALGGFALSALLDSSASALLVWRFMKEQHDPTNAEALERRAQAGIALAMLLVALYIGQQAVRALADGSHPAASAFGIGIAAVSLIVLPWLGGMKIRLASRLASPALRGDGVLTLAAAVLAAITLTALLLDSAFAWWWADAVAALLIATALAVEATRLAVRHRFG
jgi:divalent metal cation (Fe/Co/Zn/Cd) transporter